MTTVQLVALIVGAAGLVPTLADRVRVPAPVALLVAGAVLALIPGVPAIVLDPSIVVFLLLPPLVYAATLRQSLRRLCRIAWWSVVPGVLLIPAAAASGAPFPDRDFILVFTAGLVLTSALVQGMTLAALVRALELADDDGEHREEQAARKVLAHVKRERSTAMPGPGRADPTNAEPDEGSFAVFDAQRAALMGLYDNDEIGEETLMRLRQEIDLAAQCTSIKEQPPA